MRFDGRAIIPAIDRQVHATKPIIQQDKTARWWTACGHEYTGMLSIRSDNHGVTCSKCKGYR